MHGVVWQARGDNETSTTTDLPKISEGGKWMEGVLCEAKKDLYGTFQAALIFYKNY